MHELIAPIEKAASKTLGMNAGLFFIVARIRSRDPAVNPDPRHSEPAVAAFRGIAKRVAIQPFTTGAGPAKHREIYPPRA